MTIITTAAACAAASDTGRGITAAATAIGINTHFIRADPDNAGPCTGLAGLTMIPASTAGTTVAANTRAGATAAAGIVAIIIR